MQSVNNVVAKLFRTMPGLTLDEIQALRKNKQAFEDIRYVLASAADGEPLSFNVL